MSNELQETLEANLPAAKGGRPLPELIEALQREGWTIEHCPPNPELTQFNVAKKYLRVPLGLDDLSVAIRAHEMGHVKFTPKTIPNLQKASAEAMQVAENIRVNCLLRQNKVDDIDDLVIPPMLLGDATRAALSGDYRKLLFLAADARYTGGADLIDAFCKEVLPKITCLQQESLWEQIAVWLAADSTVQTTSTIAHYLDSYAIARGAKWGRALQEGPSQPEEDGDQGEEGEDSEDLPHYEGAAPSTKKLLKGLAAYKVSDSGVQWSKMQKVYTHLDRTLAGKWARVRIPHEEGAVPRSMYRLPVDQRVFDYRVQKMGGTVLIDCSGSMGLEMEDIEAVIAAAPGATVATYCGAGLEGELRLVAMNGRVAATEELTCGWGGNQVDGPALEWLIHEREPHIWVCDGGVTGNSDQSSVGLYADALRFCLLGKVIRLDDVPRAVKFLRTRGVMSEADRHATLTVLAASGGLPWE